MSFNYLTKEMISMMILPPIYNALRPSGELKECTYCRVEVRNGQCGCGACSNEMIPGVKTRFLGRNEHVRWIEIRTEPKELTGYDLTASFDDFHGGFLKPLCGAIAERIRKEIRGREHSHEVVIDDNLPVLPISLEEATGSCRSKDEDLGVACRLDIFRQMMPTMANLLMITMRFSVVAKQEQKILIRDKILA